MPGEWRCGDDYKFGVGGHVGGGTKTTWFLRSASTSLLAVDMYSAAVRASILIADCIQSTLACWTDGVWYYKLMHDLRLHAEVLLRLVVHLVLEISAISEYDDNFEVYMIHGVHDVPLRYRV